MSSAGDNHRRPPRRRASPMMPRTHFSGSFRLGWYTACKRVMNSLPWTGCLPLVQNAKRSLAGFDSSDLITKFRHLTYTHLPTNHATSTAAQPIVPRRWRMLSPCSSSPPGRSIVHLAALACMGLWVRVLRSALQLRPGGARRRRTTTTPPPWR